ncbi:MAG TPA: cytochrome c [Candidatus Manganitrophaceae bacterium]|nr:cytochrome c [Candidatus Manganitrophaceae bacterium]
MRGEKSFWVAIGLIGLGLAGIFVTGVMSGCMLPMMGGMMDRGEMRKMMREMMGGILPPGVSPRDLPDAGGEGARLLAAYCPQCHNLPSPRMQTAEDWPRVAGRMFARERTMAGMRGMMMGVSVPTPQEEEILLRYLKTYAMKALPPGAVPAPDSPGAVLFQQTCAQCHALPDPKQRAPSEWPAVVERMRSNMEAMGKRVITEEEKSKIADYLTRHAG